MLTQSRDAPFKDRVDAGRRLGARLAELGYAGGDSVALGLARGGVPVAAEVARTLGCPLDAYIVRKLGAPRNPEVRAPHLVRAGAGPQDGRRPDREPG
jgi:predicted phosphoribosyltransferase